MSGITNPAEAYFKDGIWGWDGSVWRKLPLVWGYSEGYCERVEGAASGTGHALAVGSTPTVGEEVFVVESINISHDAGADKVVIIRLNNDGCYHDILWETAVTGVFVFWTGRLTIPPGGHVEGIALTPGNGKKVLLDLWGYKMKIAE